MSESQGTAGDKGRVRVRAPLMDARSASSLVARREAVRDLIAAAERLLVDRYWLFFANPGENPFAGPAVPFGNFHILQNHQLELIASEFQLLGKIPVHRRPGGLAFAYVRLLHELLSRAERAGFGDRALVEGAARYLAIYAYLEDVPGSWISHAHADFPRQTTVVAELVGGRGKHTVADLARAYFGSGDFNAMFGGIPGNPQKSRKA